jgi:hypothetical protein
MSDELAEPADALRAFDQFLAARGQHSYSMTPREGVDAVLEFFRTQRFNLNGPDRLLFQYDTYDWGSGPWFNFDLVRQFAVAPNQDAEAGDGDAEGMWQLRLTFRFAPSHDLDMVGADVYRCESAAPESLAEFDRVICASTPYRMLADERAAAVDVELEDAG